MINYIKVFVFLIIIGCTPEAQYSSCAEKIANTPELKERQDSYNEIYNYFKNGDKVKINSSEIVGHHGVIMKLIRPFGSCGYGSAEVHPARAVVYVKALEPIGDQEQVVYMVRKDVLIKEVSE